MLPNVVFRNMVLSEKVAGYTGSVFNKRISL